MRDRDHKGKFERREHHTPGDGTGFTKLPERQAHEVLKNVNTAAGNVKGQRYALMRKEQP